MEIFELKTFFFFSSPCSFDPHWNKFLVPPCPSRIHLNKLLVPPKIYFCPPPQSRYPDAGPELVKYDKVDEKTLNYKTTEDDSRNNIFKKVTGSQHHFTVRYESGICSGEYLSHKPLPMTGSTGEVMAQHVDDALEEFDGLESTIAILVDNPSVNTGWRNGLVVRLENKLGGICILLVVRCTKNFKIRFLIVLRKKK